MYFFFWKFDNHDKEDNKQAHTHIYTLLNTWNGCWDEFFIRTRHDHIDANAVLLVFWGFKLSLASVLLLCDERDSQWLKRKIFFFLPIKVNRWQHSRHIVEHFNLAWSFSSSTTTSTAAPTIRNGTTPFSVDVCDILDGNCFGLQLILCNAFHFDYFTIFHEVILQSCSSIYEHPNHHC